jgi:hypothetical protein
MASDRTLQLVIAHRCEGLRLRTGCPTILHQRRVAAKPAEEIAAVCRSAKRDRRLERDAVVAFAATSGSHVAGVRRKNTLEALPAAAALSLRGVVGTSLLALQSLAVARASQADAGIVRTSAGSVFFRARQREQERHYRGTAAHAERLPRRCWPAPSLSVRRESARTSYASASSARKGWHAATSARRPRPSWMVSSATDHRDGTRRAESVRALSGYVRRLTAKVGRRPAPARQPLDG